MLVLLSHVSHGWYGWREQICASPYSYLYYVSILNDCTPNAYFLPKLCHLNMQQKAVNDVYDVYLNTYMLLCDFFFHLFRFTRTLGTALRCSVFICCEHRHCESNALIHFIIHVYFRILIYRHVDMQHLKNEGYPRTKCS